MGEIIVFDGAAGAGKSTLMRDVGERLRQSKAIDVDDFLNRRQGTFVSAIRFEDLRQTVFKAIHEGSPVLVASVCARDVIKRIGVVKAIYVYVRTDDDDHSAEALAEKFGEIESDQPFHREVEEYHRDYKPRQTADLVYIRKAITSETK